MIDETAESIAIKISALVAEAPPESLEDMYSLIGGMVAAIVAAIKTVPECEQEDLLDAALDTMAYVYDQEQPNPTVH